jgi:hypothetical protein
MSQINNSGELILEYENLKYELSKLKKEYEENTIIQSMNDMKKMYDIQSQKMQKLMIIIDNMNEITEAVQLMLKTLLKNINSYTIKRDYMTRFELTNRLEFINEMLNESLQVKNELYYFVDEE